MNCRLNLIGLVWFGLLVIPLTIFSQSSQSDKVGNLTDYFIKSYNSSDSIRYRKLFFDEFPDSYGELKTIYGHTEGVPGPLESNAYNHISKLFNHLDNIEKSIYYEKMIDISINGKWGADAVFYFQYGLREKIFKDPELFCDLLINRDDNEVESFFYFLFDALHPKWEELPEQLDPISQDDRIYSLMKLSFNRVLLKLKNHEKH